MYVRPHMCIYLDVYVRVRYTLYVCVCMPMLCMHAYVFACMYMYVVMYILCVYVCR
jgi:hypothetical protein